MKTAVIYARYSSSSQTDQSIEGQLTVCTKYANENNLAVVDTYIDRAMTGTNDNRPAFQQMLKDSDKRKWDIVLVYAIDRFGRNSIEIAVNKQKLQKNGIILISATQRTSENIDGTKNLDGILMENIYIGMAEYYSAELSQKILRGLQESRNKGQFCGGVIPYGYFVENKMVYINEAQAEIVRLIFREYAQGKNVPQIICQINENGVLHKGKPFLPNAVYGILRNEKYIGIYRVKDEVYTNTYPPIIDNETFEKVQKRLANNKSGKKPTKATYLLRNKLICGYCGKPVSAECGTSHTGKKQYYYKCLGKKKYKSNCELAPIRKEELEKFILENVMKAISDEKLIDRIVDGIYAEQERQNKGNSTLINLESEYKQVENALNNVMRAIEQGIVSVTTNKRLHELEEQQQELEQKIAVEKAKTIVIVSKKDIKEYYLEALKLEPQMLMNYLVKEIVLFNDKIEIIYNNPIRATSLDESQGFSFYTQNNTIKIYMGYKFEYKQIDIEVVMKIQ